MYSILINNDLNDDNSSDANDNVFVLSLAQSDRVLISPRNSMLESLANAAIVDEWPRGLQSSGAKLGGKAFEFKLNGLPLVSWSWFSSPDTQFCKTMLKMVHSFHHAGFVVQCPLDISPFRLEAGAVVLRRIEIERPFVATTTIIGIVPQQRDRLQLINGPPMSSRSSNRRSPRIGVAVFRARSKPTMAHSRSRLAAQSGCAKATS